MGSFRGTSSDIEKIITEMRNNFQGTDYHVLNRNCNTFADEFLQRLIGAPAPGYVNRMAFIGSFFSCLLPDNLNQDPTQQQQPAAGGGASSYSSGSSSGGVYRTGMNNRSSAGSTPPPPRAFTGASGVKLGK